MATSAAELRPGRGLALLALLAPSSGRMEFATRIAVICALTALVTAIYQTPEPALAAYIVFFLNRNDRTTSVITNIALTIVISVVIGLIFLVAKVVADDAMWRVISIATLSFGLLFLASASKLRPLASTLALIIGYSLDMLGTIQLGEEATRGLLYAWLFVAIPAGVSLVINLLLGPAPRRLAEGAIAQRLELSAAVLRGPNERSRLRFAECLREGAGPILGHLKLTGMEGTATPRDITALRQAAYSSIALLAAVDVIDRDPGASLPGELRAKVAETLEQMAGILRAGGYPLEANLEMPPGTVPLLPLAARAYAEIQDAVARFAVAPPATESPPAKKEKEKGGFFQEDAFTNPEHVHYAVKTTGAAVFCYILYSLLDWPGIHTCFLTCYIVSLGTTAESVEKLSLRIAGCLIGAAAGIAAIVFIMPSVTSIGGLLTTVFLGAWASAYVAGGSARISYAGFQIAFAFFLCVLQGAGPAFDMVTARDRVIGILVGIFVVYFVFTHLWPVSVSRRIDPAIASVLKRLGVMRTAHDSQQRRIIASEVQATLATIETDIELSRYEPESMRPSGQWLASRRDTTRELSALDGLLLLESDQDPPMQGSIADRLAALTSRLRGEGDALPQEAVASHAKI